MLAEKSLSWSSTT